MTRRPASSPRQAPNPPVRYLTARDVADTYQVSQRTVMRMVADGRLRATRFGRSLRFHPNDVYKTYD
jgi:excisionase family DNA binding protein